MSHSVTITRTTTTTTGSALFVNTGYLKTLPGFLKLLQLLLGIACVGLVAYYYDRSYPYHNKQTPEFFFLLVAVSFLIGTFCLLISCLMSLTTATMISKTLYELVYHGLAAIMYFAAGLTLLIVVNQKNGTYRSSYDYEPYLAASIMGLVMAGLYLLSTIFANRSYKGI